MYMAHAYMCVQTHEGARRGHACSTLSLCFYSLETGSFTEPGAGQASSKLQPTSSTVPQCQCLLQESNTVSHFLHGCKELKLRSWSTLSHLKFLKLKKKERKEGKKESWRDSSQLRALSESTWWFTTMHNSSPGDQMPPSDLHRLQACTYCTYYMQENTYTHKRKQI